MDAGELMKATMRSAEARRLRADLLREAIKARRVPVLVMNPPEGARSLIVHAVVLAAVSTTPGRAGTLRGGRDSRAARHRGNRVLRKSGAPSFARLGELTPRQAHALSEALSSELAALERADKAWRT